MHSRQQVTSLTRQSIDSLIDVAVDKLLQFLNNWSQASELHHFRVLAYHWMCSHHEIPPRCFNFQCVPQQPFHFLVLNKSNVYHITKEKTIQIKALFNVLILYN